MCTPICARDSARGGACTLSRGIQGGEQLLASEEGGGVEAHALGLGERSHLGGGREGILFFEKGGGGGEQLLAPEEGGGVEAMRWDWVSGATWGRSSFFFVRGGEGGGERR